MHMTDDVGSKRRNVMLYLIELGFEPQYKGFQYLVHLIMNNDYTMLDSLQDVSCGGAAAFACTRDAFERDIRKSIEKAWDGGCENIKRRFRFTPEGYRPTYNEVVSTFLLTRDTVMAFGDMAVSRDRLEEVRDLSPERYESQLENPIDFYKAFPEFKNDGNLLKLKKAERLK